ncbi:alpha/beta fold hydrolase [Mesorhizobium sp. NBSH29]|uniref:alpha/beta fold hydrolase n=1 Tax=Mesorhizobium sp. NBSH29 TaxID=2654249 RepID=UPI0018968B83|nr:alpha/beta fold hydrolase [Mesorhizobium sp. NBSH29]QPC85323.1 alpha/beta fold hydrolase [Mesorhizobium sp. NBSH29]
MASGQLSCSETGNGIERLVLLHGLGSTRLAWKAVSSALASHAQMLTYDLPGHGDSLDFPEAGPATLAAKAILADLNARGVERIHLAGHSMGGAVAALMALSASELIASLTLLAPGGFGDEINGRLLRRYAAAHAPEEIRACLEMMTGWRHPVQDKTVTELVAMRAIAGQSATLVAMAAAITRDERQGVIPRDRLARLNMPVAVLWGRLDAVLPVHHSDDLPPAFARHVIAGAGHMLPEEEPAFVADILLEQLRNA